MIRFNADLACNVRETDPAYVAVPLPYTEFFELESENSIARDDEISESMPGSRPAFQY